MPSTHLSLHYHIIFSTKDRAALMHKDWRGRLHSYLGGAINDLGGIPETISGVEDHVHLLLGLRATHRLADAIREIKTSSSKWVHEQIGSARFAWQEGYGAFTVSASRITSPIRKNITGREHSRKNISSSFRPTA